MERYNAAKKRNREKRIHTRGQKSCAYAVGVTERRRERYKCSTGIQRFFAAKIFEIAKI
jgi:hypothetical protein